MTRPVAGRCPACRAQTIRGQVDDQWVVVELGEHTAADELRAWHAGTRTYLLSWRDGMHLATRTVTDLIQSPAGHTPGRVYAEHACTVTTRESA